MLAQKVEKVVEEVEVEVVSTSTSKVDFGAAEAPRPLTSEPIVH